MDLCIASRDVGGMLFHMMIVAFVCLFRELRQLLSFSLRLSQCHHNGLLAEEGPGRHGPCYQGQVLQAPRLPKPGFRL